MIKLNITKGEFKVDKIVNESFITKDELLKYAAHQILQLSSYCKVHYIKAFNQKFRWKFNYNEEIPGQGIKAMVGGKEILIGNPKNF